jgi:hypothetical protein
MVVAEEHNALGPEVYRGIDGGVTGAESLSRSFQALSAARTSRTKGPPDLTPISVSAIPVPGGWPADPRPHEPVY